MRSKKHHAILIKYLIVLFASILLYGCSQKDQPDEKTTSKKSLSNNKITSKKGISNRKASSKKKLSNDKITMLLFTGAHSGNIDMVIKAIFLGAKTNAVDKNGRTPLMFAASEGHSAIVSVLLEDNFEVNGKNGKIKLIPLKTDVNARDQNGATALMAASIRGHADIVENLINEGASVNAKSKTGDTALFLAAAFGHTDVVKILLKHAANKNLSNRNGLTPLDAATKFEHREIIKLLLNPGSFENSTAQKTGIEAFEPKEKPDAEVFYQKGRSYDASSKSILAIQEYSKALSIDPKHPSALRARGLTYLQYGKPGKALTDISKALEVQPEDPVLLRSISICYSMGNNNDKALIYINKAYDMNPHSFDTLKIRANVLMLLGRYEAALADYCSALNLDPEDITIRKGRGYTYCRLNRYAEAYQDISKVLKGFPEDAMALKIMEEIKKANSSKKENLSKNSTPDYMHKAKRTQTELNQWGTPYQSKEKRTVKVFGIDSRAKQSDQVTRGALHEAVQKTDKARVQFLLKQGANPNERLSSKRKVGALFERTEDLTPLQIAVPLDEGKHRYRNDLKSLLADYIGIIELLLLYGADPNAKGEEGSTPLFDAVSADVYFAATNSSTHVLRLLLKHGANVNARALNGNTALWHSANVYVADFLLNSGADVNARNERGETPLHWFAELNDAELSSFIISRGGDVNAKDDSGITPLHKSVSTQYRSYARKKGENKIVKTINVLIKNGADINSRTKNGFTALRAAKAMGYLKAAEILMQAGAIDG